MWKLRLTALAMVAATLVGFVPSARANEDEIVHRAIDQAVAKIGDALAAQTADPVKNVAVVPLRDDTDGYATECLQGAVTASPYDLFTRSDQTWNTLVDEIVKWGDDRADIMDAETIQKFGRVQGVQAIMYGRVWDKGANLWGTRAHARVSVHLAEVETGRILWSSEPMMGQAYIHWSDAVTRFWRYPLVTLAWVIGIVIVLVLLRVGFKAIKHVNRPL